LGTYGHGSGKLPGFQKVGGVTLHTEGIEIPQRKLAFPGFTITNWIYSEPITGRDKNYPLPGAYRQNFERRGKENFWALTQA